MRTFRNAMVSLCAAIVTAAGSAGATHVTPNFSDLWWNPVESGWGLNITQQADVLFATWFVYGPGKEPIWYSATLDMEPSAGDGAMSFRGDLVQTTGPWYGAGAFNPATVTRQVVGTARFTSRDVSTGTLTYVAGGVTVTKALKRQTLRSNNMAGSYVGVINFTTFDCQAPGDNGQSAYGGLTLEVTHVGPLVTIRSDDGCAFRAQYRQAGQLGYLDAGTFTCEGLTDEVVTFAGHEVAVETTGILLRMEMVGSRCSLRADLGGVRRY